MNNDELKIELQEIIDLIKRTLKEESLSPDNDNFGYLVIKMIKLEKIVAILNCPFWWKGVIYET